MSVTFVDNSNEVLSEFEQKAKRGMTAIGQVAVGYAKKGTPVDTGRLRNSEDFKYIKSDGVYIGTNVEYAPYIEFGHRGYAGKHFLRNAVTNHTSEYLNILTASFKA